MQGWSGVGYSRHEPEVQSAFGTLPEFTADWCRITIGDEEGAGGSISTSRSPRALNSASVGNMVVVIVSRGDKKLVCRRREMRVEVEVSRI